jgi:hypothetical protein
MVPVTAKGLPIEHQHKLESVSGFDVWCRSREDWESGLASVSAYLRKVDLKFYSALLKEISRCGSE